MPSGMGMDSNTHNLFITEFQNDVVKKFTPNGILVKSWGGLGSSNGKFSDPNDVVVHSKGNVFVVDAWNMWIQKSDNNGNFYYKMALINPSINLYNEYQMLSIYVVPNSITTYNIMLCMTK